MVVPKLDKEKFVSKVLVDKESYVLNGESNGELYQFEYKVRKSNAAKNMELLEKGLVEVPRWIVYASAFASVFLATFFTASLITLGNSKSDSIYMQTCGNGKQCASTLTLKCINKTCQCESPKYYKNKCVDLSKYGESCTFTSHCDSSQITTCIGSVCTCTFTKYWDSQTSSCVDRLTHGEGCGGDQCKINSNLVCGSTGSCECIDPARYYWSSSSGSCVAKKKYSTSCTDDDQCLDSQLTHCKNNLYCLCIDTKYFDGTRCVDRVGETVTCAFDDMCLIPMYCSSTIGCRCANLYYYDVDISNCAPQKTYLEETCLKNSHCREDKNLFCNSGRCECLEGYTWSTTKDTCKLTYNQGVCRTSSDCNSDEDLICATSSSCNCPDTSSAGKCDCVRVSGNEKYWDPITQRCVSTLSYGTVCDVTYQCKTLTELTKCIDNVCSCETVGGFASWNKCKKCKDDEYYYGDRCYYLSLSTEVEKAHDVDNKCKSTGRGRALVLSSDAEIQEVANLVDIEGLPEYWISGRKTKWSWLGNTDYSWSPVSRTAVSESLCQLTKDKDCLYFDGCYKGNKDCDNKLPYICEY